MRRRPPRSTRTDTLSLHDALPILKRRSGRRFGGRRGAKRMSELDAFRTEVREWLEANCPPEMREPVRDEGDVCWGGRNWVFKNDAQKADRKSTRLNSSH